MKNNDLVKAKTDLFRGAFSLFESWWITIGVSLAGALTSIVVFLKSEQHLIGGMTAMAALMLTLIRFVYFCLEIYDRYSSREIERRMAEHEKAKAEQDKLWNDHAELVSKLDSLLDENRAERDECEK